MCGAGTSATDTYHNALSAGTKSRNHGLLSKLDAGYRNILVLDVKWVAHQMCSTGSSQAPRPGGHEQHEANVG